MREGYTKGQKKTMREGRVRVGAKQAKGLEDFW